MDKRCCGIGTQSAVTVQAAPAATASAAASVAVQAKPQAATTATASEQLLLQCKPSLKCNDSNSIGSTTATVQAKPQVAAAVNVPAATTAVKPAAPAPSAILLRLQYRQVQMFRLRLKEQQLLMQVLL